MKAMIAAALMALATTASAEQWLCVAHDAASFVGGDGVWNLDHQKSERKYIIKRALPSEEIEAEKGDYHLFRFGDDKPLAYCPDGFDIAGDLYCTTSSERINRIEYGFNKISERFASTSFSIYLANGSIMGPKMIIGSCTKF